MAYRDDGKRRSGFTLVELMIAIAIIGIVAVLAVSGFRGLNEKYRVEGETKRMYADLMDARGRALQRNRATFVRIEANGYQTYEDTSPAPDGNGALDGADTPIAGVTAAHAIIIDNLAGGTSTFRFNRNGIASVTGFLRFSSNSKPDYDCITVRETRVKLGQYDAAGGTCVEK